MKVPWYILILIIGSILSWVYYFKSEKFRKNRAKKLLQSSGFDKVRELGFRLKVIGDKEYYNGFFKDYKVVIYLESNDLFFSNRDCFSIVIIVAYEKITKEESVDLTKKNTSLLKRLFANNEVFLFMQKYAEFRFENSPFHLGLDVIENNLNSIVNLLEKNNLKRTDKLEYEQVGITGDV